MSSSTVLVPFPVASPEQSPTLGRRLLHLEDQIRRHYVNLRRRQSPSYRPKEKEGAFARAAELVHQHHADPHDFIDAQFSLNQFGSFPPPNHLGCEAAAERWRQYRAARDRDDDVIVGTDPNQTVRNQHPARVEETWRCQAMYVRLLRKRCGLNDEAIFLGEGLPLRAWFRLACAPEPLLARVEARYGTIARQQLNTDEPLARYLQHLTGMTTTTTTTTHATLRPVRQIVSRGAPVPPAAHPRVIPLPVRGSDAAPRASGF